MFKVPREFGARCRLLGGSLNAPGKYLDVENTTLNFIQEKLSSTSLSPSSSPPSCFLADIPLEILLEILDHLPDSWVISLALTCKGFYSTIAQFYQKKLALTSRDVAKFTMTLQKDIPNVYCCIGCYKLCRLNRSVSWIHQGHQNCSGPFWWDSWDWSPARRRFSKSDVQSLLWHPGTSEAMIYFMDAYLVMNRHFYGNRYGLPLRILERHAAFEKYILITDDMDMDLDWLDWDDSRERAQGRKRLKTFRQGVFDQRPERSATGNFERPWRFSFDYLPKIIDDELFMARFHRVDGPMVPWKQFATLLNSIHLPICHHLEFIVGPCGDILIQHNCKPVPLLNVFFEEMMDEERGSCPNCFADYMFSLKKDEDKKEWSFRFSTYHCLGSCRSPYDGAWNDLSDRFSDWKKYAYIPGRRIHQHWHESNDGE